MIYLLRVLDASPVALECRRTLAGNAISTLPRKFKQFQFRLRSWCTIRRSTTSRYSVKRRTARPDFLCALWGWDFRGSSSSQSSLMRSCRRTQVSGVQAITEDFRETSRACAKSRSRTTEATFSCVTGGRRSAFDRTRRRLPFPLDPDSGRDRSMTSCATHAGRACAAADATLLVGASCCGDA